MKEFNDKVVVITGAADGIGRTIAEKFAQKSVLKTHANEIDLKN